MLRATGAAGGAAGALGAALGLFGWVSWLPALAMGFVVGSAAHVGSGRHRDAAVQAVAGGMALAGMLLAAVVYSVKAARGVTAAEAILGGSFEEFLPSALAAMAGALLRFLVR